MCTVSTFPRAFVITQYSILKRQTNPISYKRAQARDTEKSECTIRTQSLLSPVCPRAPRAQAAQEAGGGTISLLTLVQNMCTQGVSKVWLTASPPEERSGGRHTGITELEGSREGQSQSSLKYLVFVVGGDG